MNACAGMGGDAREDVGQPGLRIEPFIFAVYAAQRTMPKGAGDDQLLRRPRTSNNDDPEGNHEFLTEAQTRRRL